MWWIYVNFQTGSWNRNKPFTTKADYRNAWAPSVLFKLCKVQSQNTSIFNWTNDSSVFRFVMPDHDSEIFTYLGLYSQVVTLFRVWQALLSNQYTGEYIQFWKCTHKQVLIISNSYCSNLLRKNIQIIVPPYACSS